LEKSYQQKVIEKWGFWLLLGKSFRPKTFWRDFFAMFSWNRNQHTILRLFYSHMDCLHTQNWGIILALFANFKAKWALNNPKND
jgi:hypothetical protein